MVFLKVANASPFFRRLFLKWMAVQYTSENEGLFSNCMKHLPPNCPVFVEILSGTWDWCWVHVQIFGINSEFQQNQIKLQLTSSHFGRNGQ